jgi:hypothetical protein
MKEGYKHKFEGKEKARQLRKKTRHVWKKVTMPWKKVFGRRESWIGTFYLR